MMLLYLKSLGKFIDAQKENYSFNKDLTKTAKLVGFDVQRQEDF